MRTLDVHRLPRQAHYGPTDGQTDLADIVTSMRSTVHCWDELGFIKRADSFGFAAAHPVPAVWDAWDNPARFVLFVVGWGPQGDRYVANAVRKLRATLRTRRDTLYLRACMRNAFIDMVDSREPDGSFKWGDFAWGGATLVSVGDIVLPCAVSALLEVEDDFVAKSIGARVGMEMLRSKYRPLFS